MEINYGDRNQKSSYLIGGGGGKTWQEKDVRELSKVRKMSFSYHFVFIV